MQKDIPITMLKILRQRRDLDEDDNTQDNIIKKMSPKRMVEECTAYKLGDGSWAGMIARWMNGVGADPSAWEVD